MSIEEVADDAGGDKVHSVLGFTSTFIAPSTLVLAVAYLFARSYTGAFFAYFGIDLDVLGLSNQSIAIRGANVLWLILLVLFLLVLIAGTIHASSHRVLEHKLGRAMPRFLVLASLLGAALAIFALTLYTTRSTITSTTTALALFAAGFSVAWYAWHLRSRLHSRVEHLPTVTARFLVTMGLAGILGTSLFALTSAISAQVGRGAAMGVAFNLPVSRPEIILDTKERLYTRGSSITETTLPSNPGDGQVFHYRYQGLVLLAADSGKLIVIPSDWDPTGGFAAILRDDSEIRVYYVTGGTLY